MKSYSLLAFFALALFGTAIQAYTLADFKFSDPAREQEFRELTGELRCLVCQNESLAGSNADLAQDLRREIYEMMLAGKTKDEIIQFMVARYGDFVLYQPPLKPSTYPIWFGPLFLFAIAGLLLFRALVKKKRACETSLSTQDRQRLHELLDDTPETPDGKS